MHSHFSRQACILPVVMVALVVACGGPEREYEEHLRNTVIFFSNFEKGVDALSSAGDPLVEIDGANTHNEPTGGKPDGYVSFNDGARALFYNAKWNFPYSADQAWSGGVSFWLSVDLNAQKGDFPEPFHIGKRDSERGFPWDDGVISVDFSKAPERALRFVCYPDKTGKVSEEMENKHTIKVTDLNWKADEWHHIAVTWSNFNSGKPDAEWALFVDGVEKGRKQQMHHKVTWDMNDQVIRFNHTKFAGKMDEIAIFNDMITPGAAKYLSNPRRPLNRLLKKDYPKKPL